MKKPAKTPCPCGLPRDYENCCGRYHAGAVAPNAEALMRSRYSAYALRLEAYLHATWAPETLPAEALCAEPAPKWIGLEVKRHEVTGADTAIVEFIARCRVGGRAVRMHEISRFRRENGRWLYIDGDQL